MKNICNKSAYPDYSIANYVKLYSFSSIRQKNPMLSTGFQKVKIRGQHILDIINAQFRNRTRDTRIFSPLLYQLS